MTMSSSLQQVHDNTNDSSYTEEMSESNRKRRVSFAATQTQFFAQSPHEPHGADDKSLRWYTAQDLLDCREEARQALHALHQANGDLQSVDHERHCMRGIEKFGDVVAKMQTQRILKESILNKQRQTKQEPFNDGNEQETKVVRACPEQLAVLSRYLSQPSRDMAHQFALANAKEALEDADAHSTRLGSSGGDAEGQPQTPTDNRLRNSGVTMPECAKDAGVPVWISPKPVVSLFSLSAVPSTPPLITAEATNSGRVRHHTVFAGEDDDEGSQEDNNAPPSNKKVRLYGPPQGSTVLRQVSE